MEQDSASAGFPGGEGLAHPHHLALRQNDINNPFLGQQEEIIRRAGLQCYEVPLLYRVLQLAVISSPYICCSLYDWSPLHSRYSLLGSATDSD